MPAYELRRYSSSMDPWTFTLRVGGRSKQKHELKEEGTHWFQSWLKEDLCFSRFSPFLNNSQFVWVWAFVRNTMHNWKLEQEYWMQSSILHRKTIWSHNSKQRKSCYWLTCFKFWGLKVKRNRCDKQLKLIQSWKFES